jgi:hypothetical protein
MTNQNQRAHLTWSMTQLSRQHFLLPLPSVLSLLLFSPTKPSDFVVLTYLPLTPRALYVSLAGNRLCLSLVLWHSLFGLDSGILSEMHGVSGFDDAAAFAELCRLLPMGKSYLSRLE